MLPSLILKVGALHDSMKRRLKTQAFPRRYRLYQCTRPLNSIGDASEMHALKAVFQEHQTLKVSSTKALTGHGLSLSSIMEAGFCCLGT